MQQKKRREFIKEATAFGIGIGLLPTMSFSKSSMTPKETISKNQAVAKAVQEAFDEPVLQLSQFKEPIIIDDIQLCRYKDNFICKVRTHSGAEGLSVSNNYKMVHLYPIFLQQVAPFFIGKDARNLERLIEEVYIYKSNYKMQGYPLWVPVATIEFAILDLLGKLSRQSMSAFLGPVRQPKIGVYRANNFRGKSAEDSIARIKEQVEKTNARALKFKVGGRMRKNVDFPAGRSEKLIPLIRKSFGDDMTIYADSNGSYDVKEAIRIGKMMEREAFNFYEEPVPFDWYNETNMVNKALSIPIAGGEQEPSMRNFKWLIESGALDIVQPDIFYFGGMIRSFKVAKMANVVGKTCVPHISGSGLGYLYMMHFVSALPNAGPFHEFKGFNNEIPLHCETSTLTIDEGYIKVPSGPGLGVEIDPDFIAKHKVIERS